jgi:hypothetical protein
MNKKSYLAGLLVLPLGVAELGESHHPRSAGMTEAMIGSGWVDTVPNNPHTHCDVEIETDATGAFPFFAYGARHAEKTFRLHVVPQQTRGVRLVAHPALNLWVTRSSEIQNMYGFCENVEALTDVLTSQLGLPQSQVEAIRKTALEDGEQEIGGYTAMRVFRRSELERLGMNFRPPEA